MNLMEPRTETQVNEKELPADSKRVTPDSMSTRVDSLPVEISTRFLEHFSEQLYLSPQEALDELITGTRLDRMSNLLHNSELQPTSDQLRGLSAVQLGP